MECPRCSETLLGALQKCTHCGFSRQSLDEQLGTHSIVLERLTDTAHCLRLRDQRALDAALDDFERRLPQCFCSVYFGVLPLGINVAEAGFWLLNHGVRSVNGAQRSGNFGIIITIDPAAHCVGVTLGYGLEFFIPQRHIQSLLQKTSQSLWHGEYADALNLILRDLEKRIRAQAQPQRREIARPSAEVQPATLPGVNPATKTLVQPPVAPTMPEKARR